MSDLHVTRGGFRSGPRPGPSLRQSAFLRPSRQALCCPQGCGALRPWRPSRPSGAAPTRACVQTGGSLRAAEAKLTGKVFSGKRGFTVSPTHCWQHRSWRSMQVTDHHRLLPLFSHQTRILQFKLWCSTPRFLLEALPPDSEFFFPRRIFKHLS